jgi:hypothetical protein
MPPMPNLRSYFFSRDKERKFSTLVDLVTAVATTRRCQAAELRLLGDNLEGNEEGKEPRRLVE